ncbi:copper-translocating P-type ATPase [Cyphellophora europaea CBS 101466]|uniref:Copper-translocating P-type ATPase n=1 Tax=Cyphellophora europaea (strain CBS 101466) TaxID=1220924 RepID=W2S636_CYPE1|nr:copper-translocating P-type ATPase [Cyphellophora europaea CBS 101466]ETN44085.1 copper-translocating P-type ATPase [Cyphellophora europaea CBS 101466]
MSNSAEKPEAECLGDCCGHAQATPSTAASSASTLPQYCDQDEKCDEACIKAAAALECKLACETATKECAGQDCHSDADKLEEKHGHAHANADGHPHDHEHDEVGLHGSEACDNHILAAMEKYSAYLETARCICRSVLASTSKIEKGCAGSMLPIAPPMPHGVSSGHLYRKDRSTVGRRHTAKTTRTLNTEGHEHRHHGHNHGHDTGKHACDHDHDQEQDPDTSKERTAASLSHGDVEKGATTEHFLLNVTGMDCSGCANNLTRAFQNVPGVSNVQVIFINNTAEIDVDTKITSFENAIRLAQRATGYQLVPFSADSQSIDLVLDTRTAKSFQDSLPYGVDSCTKVLKNVFEVYYDPCLIGARELVDRSGGQLAPPRNDRTLDAGHRRLVWVASLTFAAFVFTMPVVVMEWGDFQTIPHRTVLIISLVLATVVQTLAYPEFYKPAISALIYNRVLEMDMLVVISITAAYGYSVVAFGLIFDGRDLETSPFFETSTLLITLVLLGRLLAAWARKRAVSKVSLRSLQASTAMLLDPATDITNEIDARLLQYGDTIIIPPHSQIVTDADVSQGTSEVDESMLTGESLPVLKTVGSSVISGTVNGAGSLKAKVTRLPGKNTITDIANLVEQAQSSKPRIQDLADKVASYFIPVVCTAAVIVFVVWLIVGLRGRRDSVDGAIGTAIGYCIAVLAVSCPCALGLAVPMVLVVAGGIAAQGGIIIKTADVTERGHKVTDVVFDKTGTLTEGNLDVVHEEVFAHGDLAPGTDVYSIALALVKDNKHPVSQAVASVLSKRPCHPVNLQDVVSVPGCGIDAAYNNLSLRAGNPRWLEVDAHPKVLALKQQGSTLLCITLNGQPLAIFGLKSTLRANAPNVIRELVRRKIAVHILSGDIIPAVQAVASTLDISPENAHAECSPALKQEYIRGLMEQGKTTMFIGDGTNDAVAVAQADVGVQIGESASDVTRGTADVVLLGGLDGVLGLLDVSKAAYRRIMFNFGWSATYNVLAVLLAGGAFVKIRIPPAFAGLGEIVSVLPVVVAALTMPKVKKTM